MSGSLIPHLAPQTPGAPHPETNTWLHSASLRITVLREAVTRMLR